MPLHIFILHDVTMQKNTICMESHTVKKPNTNRYWFKKLFWCNICCIV